MAGLSKADHDENDNPQNKMPSTPKGHVDL